MDDEVLSCCARRSASSFRIPGGFRVDVKAAISRIGQYHYNRNIREQLAHPCGRAWAGDGRDEENQ